MGGAAGRADRAGVSNFFPRLALYEAAGLDCPLLLRWKPRAQVLTMLEALGFGPERVVFHATDDISLFPKLFVPCWPSGDKTAPMSGLAEDLPAGRGDAGPRAAPLAHPLDAVAGQGQRALDRMMELISSEGEAKAC